MGTILNSLIDDPAVAGDKAFNWHEAFPQVLEKGGFDVVIGNPPYGILIDKDTQTYYNEHFPLTKYKTNLYVLFIERMLQIFDKGLVFFIIPKSLLFNSFYEAIRKHLIIYSEIKEIFTITEKVFDDAEVGSSLLLLFSIQKNINQKNIVRLAATDKVTDFVLQTNIIENKVPQDFFLSLPNCEISIVSSESQSVLTKLSKLRPVNSFYSLKNGLNPGNVKHILISTIKENDNYKPIIWGKDISRYHILWSGEYINYDESIGNNIRLEDIKSKEGMNKQNRIDFALRSPELFEAKKIVIRKTGDSLICCLDEANFYFDTLVHGIYEKQNDYNLEFLEAILNSKPATKLYRLLHDIQGKVFAKISLDNLSSFPIPDCTLDVRYLLEEKVKVLSRLYTALQDVSIKFQRSVERNFEFENLSKKLQNWYQLSYSEFLKELSKRNNKISLSQEAEWEDYFLQEKDKALALKAKIDSTDREIDQMVYEMYGLKEDEIKIVENS